MKSKDELPEVLIFGDQYASFQRCSPEHCLIRRARKQVGDGCYIVARIAQREHHGSFAALVCEKQHLARGR